MSTVIVKQSSGWIFLPATDEIRPYWINLNVVRKVTYTEMPVACTLHYEGRVQQYLTGLQAIAIIDELGKISGGAKGD